MTLEIDGLTDTDRLAVTQQVRWIVAVEDGREGSRSSFTVEAADIQGAVEAAKANVARRVTDRIVVVTPDVQDPRYVARQGRGL